MGHREIPLHAGQVALVSEEDYPLVSQYRWHLHRSEHGVVYARACPARGVKLMMHRLIMSQEGMLVDHINHNGLDNRRENLRIASPSQNGANARPRSRKLAKFKGVDLDTRSGKWRARIRVKRRLISLGRFHLEEDAARAYDAAALKHFGEFAYLNFPEPKAAA